MSVKITYFVHGTTLDNENGISSGWNNVELSPLGIKQSKDLKNEILDKKFDVVFVSDLKRAVDSAKLTFGEIVPIVQDKRLRECNYGDYNGKSSDIVEPLQEKSIFNPMPNGESYEDVRVRVSDFLKDLENNYDGKSVAIVAHKAPQLVLDVILKGKSWEQAFAEDWRKAKSWKPGWNYVLGEKRLKPKNMDTCLIILSIFVSIFLFISTPFYEEWLLPKPSLKFEMRHEEKDNLIFSVKNVGEIGIKNLSIKKLNYIYDVKHGVFNGRTYDQKSSFNNPGENWFDYDYLAPNDEPVEKKFGSSVLGEDYISVDELSIYYQRESDLKSYQEKKIFIYHNGKFYTEKEAIKNSKYVDMLNKFYSHRTSNQGFFKEIRGVKEL